MKQFNYRGALIQHTLSGVWWTVPGQVPRQARSVREAMQAVSRAVPRLAVQLPPAQPIEPSPDALDERKATWRLR